MGALRIDKRHPLFGGSRCMWGERDEATNHSIGFRRLSGWVRRSFDVVAADLRPVDSGSLDVLLYCTDDVAVSARGDWALTGPAELA